MHKWEDRYEHTHHRIEELQKDHKHPNVEDHVRHLKMDERKDEREVKKYNKQAEQYFAKIGELNDKLDDVKHSPVFREHDEERYQVEHLEREIG